jgi:hypothetical protein
MWPNRRLIDLLQIEHPLILAPMTGFGIDRARSFGLQLYREAGNPKAPVALLLHGFPTSSHM